jgi:pimeloyl-ACP methyl ester carboxylesterase
MSDVSFPDRLELAAGKAQLTVLRHGLAALARLRAGELTTSDMRLAYLARAGTGLPMVFIHGFGGDKETWLMVAPQLGWRRGLALLDLPGHGMSGELGTRSASLRAQADAVVQLMDHLGMPRAVVVGNSMGGGIALRLAADHPARVAGLVLVASVGPQVAASEVGAAMQRGENLLIPRTRSELDAFMKTMVEKPPPVPRAVQRYVADARVKAQGRLDAVYASWQAAPRSDDLPADLGAVAAPALILHGDRDRVIHPATAEALAAGLPRAWRVPLEGIGHGPQLEAPRRVAQLIDGFVSTLS